MVPVSLKVVAREMRKSERPRRVRISTTDELIGLLSINPFFFLIHQSPPQHQHLLNLATRSTQSIEAKPHLTLPDSLLKLAQLHPHLTAIDWYDPEIETRLPRLQISFHQLIQHAHRLSQFILQHPHFSSPQPSHRSTKTVALYMHKNPIMPIAMLAVSMSGAAYLNLEPSQPLGRLKTLLHQTSPLLLLTYNLDPESDDPELKALVKASDQQQLEIINTADYFDDLLFPNQHGLSSKQILSNQTNLNSILTFRARPESTAYIICTSGTTGLPKTIPITHSNLSSFLQNYRHRFGRGQPGESRVLQFASSAFDVIVVSIWDTLMVSMIQIGSYSLTLFSSRMAIFFSPLLQNTPHA